MEKFKNFYILFLLVIFMLSITTLPTYAKFSSDYTTDSDVVGLDLNFNIGISNIEEYQEIKVGANSHKAFNIDITNSYDDIIYYGVWYKMISPKTLNDNIKIARVNSSEISTYGSIESGNKQVVNLVIINNTNDIVKVAIGVGSSDKSTNDIEYLGGKSLVVDYANIPINENASNYIKELYHDEDKITTVNVGKNKENPKVFLNSDNGIMLDNNGEYRYYGINPNNYVLFNNELWRIISVSKVYGDSSKKLAENRVKLIRNDPFGVFVWDSSDKDVNGGIGINEWSLSSISNILNDLYYNSSKGKCVNDINNASIDCDFSKLGLSKEAKGLIDNAMFYLGGVDASKLDKLYANDYYNLERGTSVFDCVLGDGCPRSTSYVGNVGLMYASDYAYSVNNISLDVVPFKYSYNANSWLRLTSDSVGHEYTITPTINTNNTVLGVNYNFGNLTNLYYDDTQAKWVGSNVSKKMKIRPVVYLKEDATIVDGAGTLDNPYTLK